jgi:hypothetical protein
MTRDDFLWVAIKSIGLYFLAQGLVSTVAFFLAGISGAGSSTGGDPWILGTLFSAGVGAYLLFGGSWIVKMAAGSVAEREQADKPGDLTS